MNVGLIGFGQLGRSVTQRVLAGEAGDTEVVTTLVRDAERATASGAIRPTTDLESFLAAETELVVEVAGHAALGQYAVRVLESGKDLLAVSVGAFANQALLDAVIDAARRSGHRVQVPSGAIAGLDMISAAALGPVDLVRHTTRKNPRAFTSEQLAGHDPVDEAVLLFEGPARDGVGRYPENVNVAAAVSLAGIGLDRTQLRVYADPKVDRNQHEVEVEGFFGRLHIEVDNIPSENPKTGRVVAMSIAKALRNRTAPFVIGG